MLLDRVAEPELPPTGTGERTEEALDEIADSCNSDQAGDEYPPCVEVHRCSSSLVLHKYTIQDACEQGE